MMLWPRIQGTAIRGHGINDLQLPSEPNPFLVPCSSSTTTRIKRPTFLATPVLANSLLFAGSDRLVGYTGTISSSFTRLYKAWKPPIYKM